MKKYLIVFILLIVAISSKGQDAAELAQQQLDAYNNRNIEAFLEPYSDTVKIYSFPNTLLYTGKEKMKQRYGNMFQNTPELHCNLLNRIVQGNTVIDQEEVTISSDREKIYAIAIYKVWEDKIQEVYFIYKE